MYHTHYTLNMICNHECIHVPFTTTSVITQYGQTALMIAVSEGYTEVVVELVKAKANLDLQNNVCIYINTMVCNMFIIMRFMIVD